MDEVFGRGYFHCHEIRYWENFGEQYPAAYPKPGATFSCMRHLGPGVAVRVRHLLPREKKDGQGTEITETRMDGQRATHPRLSWH